MKNLGHHWFLLNSTDLFWVNMSLNLISLYNEIKNEKIGSIIEGVSLLINIINSIELF